VGDQLLTVNEVADFLRVDGQTVRRWIRQGRIPAHNLGGKAGYRIRSADVQAFLEATRGGQEGKVAA
jgi:excisionase family DNA binding protein